MCVPLRHHHLFEVTDLFLGLRGFSGWRGLIFGCLSNDFSELGPLRLSKIF